MPNFKNDSVVSITDNTNTPAVKGESSTLQGVGVYGRSTYQSGVHGESQQANGVLGFSSSDGHAGVAGANDEGNGNGVYGRSAKSDGVIGITTGDGKAGVAGVCDTGNGNGVYGRSNTANGVVGSSSSDVHAGVAGVNDNSAGIGIYGKGGRLAGLFDGEVAITGRLDVSKSTITCFDLTIANADCAEDFEIETTELVEPGTVMVLGEGGKLFPSLSAFDKRVVGVISGAGKYKPGIVLDKHKGEGNRLPVALLGKVYCKADAQYAAIMVGDLLTTSPTPGHAMKASADQKAFGSIIGKALRALPSGNGLIPILVSLQ
jgi:hypothetical protein